MDGPIGLGGLFLSSFLAATLLPGGSEIVFVAVLAAGASLWPALAVATGGNTLGGASSYLIGRLVPETRLRGPALDRVRRGGSPGFFLVWGSLLGGPLG